MTSWDFYSKFLHYNSFVYEKMYGKINCRFDKKGDGRYMNELLERYIRKQVIETCISMCIKFNQSREETISELIQRFNLTEEDAEEYYDEYCDEAVQQ